MFTETLTRILDEAEKGLTDSLIRDDLSVSEVLSLYLIDRMYRPTIAEYANRISISQSNATYVIHKLVNKGYVAKVRSNEDKREFRLETTEKFSRNVDYRNIFTQMIERLNSDPALAEDEAGQQLADALAIAVLRGIQDDNNRSKDQRNDSE